MTNKTHALLFGIKNCDKMKQALKWMDNQNIDYIFHDYKKSEFDDKTFCLAIKQHGWENVINKRGTTWRNLSDSVKNDINDQNAIDLAKLNPSIIKRPMLYYNDKTYLGFDDKNYHQIFFDNN